MEESRCTIREMSHISVHDDPGCGHIALLHEGFTEGYEMAFVNEVGVNSQQVLHEISLALSKTVQIGLHSDNGTLGLRRWLDADRLNSDQRLLCPLLSTDRSFQPAGFSANEGQTQNDGIWIIRIQPDDFLFGPGQIVLGKQRPDAKRPASAVRAKSFLERICRDQGRVMRANAQQRIAVVQDRLRLRLRDPGTQGGREKIDDRARLRGFPEDHRQPVRKKGIPLLRRIGRFDLLVGGIQRSNRLVRIAPGQLQHPLPFQHVGILRAALNLADLMNGFLRASQQSRSRPVRHGKREYPLDATLGKQRAQGEPIVASGKLPRAGCILRVGQFESFLRQLDGFQKGRLIAVCSESPIVTTGREDQRFNTVYVERSRPLGGLDGSIELRERLRRIQIGRV